MREFLFATLGATLILSSPAKAESEGRCNDFMMCLFGARHRNQPLADPAAPQLRGIKDQYGHAINLSGASRREMVDWNEDKYPQGSIIIRADERALYYVSGEGEAVKYAIGGAVSSGCIRMMNADVIDLYQRTKVGAKVWVYQ